MIARRPRRLLGGLVILAGTLLLAEAAHAACVGPAGNWVACPPGVPANASITGVTFLPTTTTVQFTVAPFFVILPGMVPLTATPPDTAKTYAALKFLDYDYRLPDGDLLFGRAWARFDDFAQRGPFHELFEKSFDVRASLLAPPRAIRQSDAATAGVPELLPPAGPGDPSRR